MTKILLRWHVIKRFKLLRSLDLGIVAKKARFMANQRDPS